MIRIQFNNDKMELLWQCWTAAHRLTVEVVQALQLPSNILDHEFMTIILWGNLLEWFFEVLCLISKLATSSHFFHCLSQNIITQY